MKLPQILLLLIGATAVRLAYQAMIFLMDGSFTMNDSIIYMNLAESLPTLRELFDGAPAPDTDRMPVYPYFLAFLIWIFGEAQHLTITAAQAAVDSLTVLGIALAARAVDRRLTWPAAMLAVFWPVFVVYAAIVLTDTLFMMFFTWGLCASLWAARSECIKTYLVAAGICFGLALMTRPVLQFFPIFLLPALSYLILKSAGSFWRAFLLACLPILIMGLFAMPRLANNYVLYGAPVFSTQSGTHLMDFYYPCLAEPIACGGIIEIKRQNLETIAARRAKLPPEEAANPLMVDRLRRELGLERIATLSFQQITYGLTMGAVRGFFLTSFREMGQQLRLNVNFFSTVPGKSFSVRLKKLFSEATHGGFLAIWLGAQLALLLSRLVQFGGFLQGLRNPDLRPMAVFLFVTAIYFLAVNGPIGYAKYRLPLEPALIIFLTMGLSRPQRLWAMGLSRLQRLWGWQKRATEKNPAA